MDVVVDEVVDKEVAKVKKLVQEVNEGLVLVCRCSDGRRGDQKVVIEMMWCWTKRLTWRSTRKLTKRWPTLSTSRWLGSFGYFWGKC